MTTPGEWASLANRLLAEKKDLELQHREAVEAIERARTHTGLEADGCPLCTYINGVFTAACAMHRKIESLEAQKSEAETAYRALNGSYQWLGKQLGEANAKADDALRLNNEGTALLLRLLELEQYYVAREGAHPEFCDCKWCHFYGDVRVFLGMGVERPKDGNCGHECVGRVHVGHVPFVDVTTCEKCNGLLGSGNHVCKSCNDAEAIGTGTVDPV